MIKFHRVILPKKITQVNNQKQKQITKINKKKNNLFFLEALEK